MAVKELVSNAAPATAPNADFLNNLIPGYNNLVGQASGVIGDLLAGTPSPSTTRNAAATFGAANGLGTGSGIANRWGYDLYNTLGNQRQQQGLGALNNIIGATSSPALSNQGQQLQNQQFNANLSQQGSQFGQSLNEQKFNDQINALIGLSNAGIGGTVDTYGGGQSYLPTTSSYAYL